MTQQIFTGFPTRRLRRMRKQDFSRRLMAEHKLTVIPYLLLKAKIIVKRCLPCQT